MEHTTFKEIIQLMHSTNPREAVAFCQRLGLIRGDDDGPSCAKPRCTVTRMKLSNSEPAIDKCRWYCNGYIQAHKRKRKLCCTIVSVRSHTIFAHSKLDLWQILLFIWLWSSCAVMPMAIGSMTGMSPKTVVDWASFCRDVVFDAIILNGSKLGGPGMVVEVGLSKFGNRYYRGGQQFDGTWVFGGFERGSGKIFMMSVTLRSKSFLLPIIKHWIEPGTTIISDSSKSYDCLINECFQHLRVNYKFKLGDSNTIAHNNSIRSSWRHAKESISTEGRTAAALDGNLARYIFCKSCKRQNKNFFDEFCKIAASIHNGLPNSERTTARMASYKELQDDLARITIEEKRVAEEHASQSPSLKSVSAEPNLEFDDDYHDDDWDLLDGM